MKTAFHLRSLLTACILLASLYTANANAQLTE